MFTITCCPSKHQLDLSENGYNLLCIHQGLREAFYKFDDDHDGQITRGEFRRVLKLFMINMTDYEFDRLMNKFEFGKDKTLNYRDFLKKFEEHESIEGHGWLKGARK